MSPDERILSLLKEWAPEVIDIITRAGYFDLPRGSTRREDIAKQIGFNQGGRIYRQVLKASQAKNESITEIVINEFSLREFKAGARAVAKQINRPFQEFDWNEGAQQHFKKHGLELVKCMTNTDLSTLRDRIQYDFSLSPDAFAKRYANSYVCSEARLRRIKRTETHTNNEAGGFNYAKNAECEFKQWLCAPRAIWPRPRHRVLWFEIAKINEAFSNGLMYPSEPNCRCYLIYFIDRNHLKWGAKHYEPMA